MCVIKVVFIINLSFKDILKWFHVPIHVCPPFNITSDTRSYVKPFTPIQWKLDTNSTLELNYVQQGLFPVVVQTLVTLVGTSLGSHLLITMITWLGHFLSTPTASWNTNVSFKFTVLTPDNTSTSKKKKSLKTWQNRCIEFNWIKLMMVLKHIFTLSLWCTLVHQFIQLHFVVPSWVLNFNI